MDEKPVQVAEPAPPGPSSDNLLHVVDIDPSAFANRCIPIIMEFPVSGELGPFLVSSTRATKWIPRPFGGKIRAAFRNAANNGEYFAEVVLSIARMGSGQEWGNVCPLNADGLGQALKHLLDYDMVPGVMMFHPGTDRGGISDDLLSAHGLFPQHALWMPAGHAVVIPTDREYVGILMRAGEKIVSVIHNPGRAICIIKR